MKLLEIGKDMKIKYNVSFPNPPYKVWGNCFLKEALHGGTNFFRQIYGEMFYMGTNDLIMQGGD